MKRTFYLQISIVVLAVLAALLTTPYLKKFFVDDGTRIDLMCEWVNDDNLQPEIVVFGGSDAMSGVNGYLLEEKLNKSVLSMTNTGQFISQSSLFFSKLSENTKIVILCRAVGADMERDEPEGIEASRYIYNGYELDSISKAFIGEKNASKFNKTRLQATFELRGFLKEGINTVLRDHLFRPNPCADSIKSKIYPYYYVYENAPESQFTKYSRPQQKPDEQILTDFQVDRFKSFNDYFKQRGIEFYLVLMPTSTYMSNRVPSVYKPQFEAFSQQTEIPILDLTVLLDDDEFYDPNHPNRSGAVKVTNAICDFIMNQSKNVVISD